MSLSTLPPHQYAIYGNTHYATHVLLLMLAEKKLSFALLHGNDDELAQLNPYKTLPILANREIALYEPSIIAQYLEDRHPSPALLPATPKERAQIRTLLWRINKDWLSVGCVLLTHPDSVNAQTAAAARKNLTDTLTTIAPLFAEQPYFLSDAFTLCDAWLVPFLWRLEQMGITLCPKLCRAIFDYQARQITRPSFKATLAARAKFTKQENER